MCVVDFIGGIRYIANETMGSDPVVSFFLVVGGVASGDGGRIGYVPWVPSASVACGSFVTRYPRLLRGQPLAETWHFETMGSDPVVSFLARG